MTSVLDYIPASLHAAIRNSSSRADVSAYVQRALDSVDSNDATIQIPPGLYRLDTPISIKRPGTTIEADGALIVGMHTTLTGMVHIPASGAGTTIRDGDWRIGSGAQPPWIFEVQAHGVTLADLAFGKLPPAGGYITYVRFGADGFKMVNCRTYGGNGIYVESSDVLIMANRFVGRASGGDDAIAIKAIQGSISNIRVVGNYVENLIAACSIGSEIGPPGRNDPSRSRQVSNVVIEGNTCKNCSNIARLKPNGVSTVDYRDGTIEGVTISDNTLEDRTGAKLDSGIAIYPGRGGIVRRVRGDNNVVVGRWSGSGTSTAALDILLVDLSVENPGVKAPKVEDIDIGVTFTDPFGGVPQGAVVEGVAATGRPFNQIVKIEKQTLSHGSMRDIRLRVTGDGCQHIGVAIAEQLDDAVTFQRLHLDNVNRNGSGSNAGLQANSRVRIEDARINMFAGHAYGMHPSSGDIVGQVDEVPFVAESDPGSDVTRRVWVAPRRCMVTRIELRSEPGISRSPDDSHYTQFEVRNLGGTTNVFDLRNSARTRGQAFPAGVYTIVALARLLAGANYADCFFDTGAGLSVTKKDSGRGNPLRNASLRIHWAPY